MSNLNERMADSDACATMDDISRLKREINSLMAFVEELESELIINRRKLDCMQVRNGALYIKGKLE